MPVTIDGTTGVTTPGATVGSITGILKATSGVVSQAVAGTDYLTSTSGGAITLATAQTATGTAVDFTGIPSWVKRITVMFNGVSTSVGSQLLVRLGSGSIATTGYVSTYATIEGTTVNCNSTTVGFSLYDNSASYTRSGHMVLTLLGSNTWVSSHTIKLDTARMSFGGGNITLAGTLDRIQITSTSGTDTFDAGTINISYE